MPQGRVGSFAQRKRNIKLLSRRCCIERFLCVLRGCSCNWPAKSNLLVYFSFFFLHNRYQGVCRQSNAICCSFGCALSSWTSSLLRCARNKLRHINPTFFLHCTDFVPSIWGKLRVIIRLMKDVLPSNLLQFDLLSSHPSLGATHVPAMSVCVGHS